MAVAKLSSCVAVVAAAASLSAVSAVAHADSSYRFPYFSSSPSSSSSSSSSDQNANAKSDSESPASEEPRGSEFDPEALERGAKALREIKSSSYSKQVSLLQLFVYLKFDRFCFSWEKWKKKKWKKVREFVKLGLFILLKLKFGEQLMSEKKKI